MNPEALRRIEAVRQFRSTVLDLRGFKLEAVPDALSDLVQLEELNLDNNFLTDLPAWFTRLNQLKNLWIGNNRLVAMPIVLQSLPNVLSLALHNNRITGLPHWLQEMTQLKAFLVHGNPVLDPMPLRSLIGQIDALGVDQDLFDLIVPELAATDCLSELVLHVVRPEDIGDQLVALGSLRKLRLLGQLTALPEALGQLTQLQQLDVRRNQLTALPESLGQLPQLQRLYVSGNQLTALPESLSQLTQLQKLYVSGNQLTALPEALGQLIQLQLLEVSYNQLTTLPEVLRQLTQLQQLDVRNNQLTTLPESLGQLTQLQQLHVGGNKLTALPEALGQLTQLQQLDVEGNQLTALPEALGQLTQLQRLYVRHIQLTELPESLGQLTQLQQLDVSLNQLTELPEVLGQLTQLQHLDVSRNQLTALPKSLVQLTQLQELYVWGNQLTELPEALGQLTQLQELYVSDNQLPTLPEAVSRCRKLAKLDLSNNALSSLPKGLLDSELTALWLHGNPALGLSSSVLGPYEENTYRRHDEQEPRDPRSILTAFFASRAQDSEPLNEVKLVLVGRGSAGKTSIARRLVKNTFSRAQKETQGIDIARWKLNCGAREVRVNLWDFAGQVVTHATHQFFLSESSIYLLVLTGREDTQKIDAEYWLKLVRAFAANDQGEVAPVIVVLNKYQDHPFKVDRLALKERYPFIVDFVETDCKTAQGIADLKTRIAATIDAMPMVRQGFKRSWWKIKRALEQAQRKQNYLPYSSFQQICSKYGETEPAPQRFLADVFHALGVALNYGRDERLRDATVLNPRWVTEGIYKLLRTAVPDDGSALLTLASVKSVLPAEPEEMQRYLVSLMQRFDLAFPLNESDDQWLVPQRLPAEQPDLGAYAEAGAEATRLRFTYPVVPEGLLPRFIARTYPLSETDAGGAALPRWASGVVLAQGDAVALVKVDSEERRITIVVRGSREARLELLGVIQSDFRTIHRDIKGLEEKEELEVEGQPGIYVDVRTLKADERHKNLSSAATPEGTVSLNPTEQLNRLSEPPAREELTNRPRVFISYCSKDA